MSNYRRARTPGASYFFTLVTYQRRELSLHEQARYLLRDVIREVRLRLPFIIDAWVLLPDHMHCIWTLPRDDHDFSKRWGLIKAGFSKRAKFALGGNIQNTVSRIKHRESEFWQRRYWEHQLRNEQDFKNHMDYIHYNPVKHGLVEDVCSWPYSTFHRYVDSGIYPMDWGGKICIQDDKYFGE